MMPHRSINGLKRAYALAARPDFIPPVFKPCGAKAAGRRFERSLHRALKGSVHGQWFSFEDSSGLGYCQTDLLFSFLPDHMVVVEVKYTLVPGAHSKLANLYVPVVEKALGCPAAGVVVVKNLDPRFRRGLIFTNLHDA